jgi:hypothetical protein
MPRFKYYDIIKMYSKGTECDGMDWLHLTEDKDQERPFLETVLSSLIKI